MKTLVFIENLKKISGGKENRDFAQKTKDEAKNLKGKIHEGFEEHRIPHVHCHKHECRWID